MYSNWNYQNLPGKMCRLEKNRVLCGCNSTFEHPAYLNSGKKWRGSIYLLSFGGNYSCAPSEIPRLE
jgi:hypothetical protein